MNRAGSEEDEITTEEPPMKTNFNFNKRRGTEPAKCISLTDQSPRKINGSRNS